MVEQVRPATKFSIKPSRPSSNIFHSLSAVHSNPKAEAFLASTVKILEKVNEKNPECMLIVGETIFPHVASVFPEKAPRITAFLICYKEN